MAREMSKRYSISLLVFSKCSVFPLLFGAEHYRALEIALTNVGQHYLRVTLFHIEFCNDVAF
jgi:hypothetical protein